MADYDYLKRVLGDEWVPPPGETHIDRECRVLGHEFAHEPDAEEGDPAACIHCGVEEGAR